MAKKKIESAGNFVSDIKKTRKIIAQTKERLRAYPQLKRNLERYKLDIESIKNENFGKSKSIVVFQPTYREPLTTEDKRAAAIALVEKKKARDEREIRYIELALDGVKNDRYYPAFNLYIFRYMTTEEVGEKVNVSQPCISRNLNRLLNQIAVFFYGAEAFAPINE